MSTLTQPGGGTTTIERTDEELLEDPVDEDNPSHRVILYNDDWHAFDEVILQVQKATGYDLERVVPIVIEAHTEGRAVCYRAGRDRCQRVARVLREIRLQVEVDSD
jgi:ATP-dependent Clp protease adaptor protein ClpS